MRAAPLLLAFLAACAMTSAPDQTEYRDADGAPVARAEATARLRAADVAILGEIHDNPAHHAEQARLVAAIRPAALVFEMIPSDRSDALNRLRAEGAGRDAIAAALDWETSGWPDFALYAPILEAAPDALALGAGLPRADVRRAFDEGAAAAFGDGAARFGLARPLDPATQAALEREQDQAHCGAMPAAMLAGMVEAQRLRDAAFAAAVLRARDRTGGGRVALITGDGHARADRGVPAYLAVAAPGLKVVSLGQIEGEAEPGAPFDLIRLTAGVPGRGDPCEALRARAAAADEG